MTETGNEWKRAAELEELAGEKKRLEALIHEMSVGESAGDMIPDELIDETLRRYNRVTKELEQAERDNA